MPTMQYIRPGAGAVPTKAARQQVYALMQQIAEEVDTLGEGAMRAIRRPLMMAQQELERDIAALLKKLPDGNDTFQAHHYRMALRQIRGALKAIDDIKPVMREAFRDGRKAAAVMSNKNLEKEMARLTAAMGEGSLQKLDLMSVNSLMRADSWLVKRHESSLQKYNLSARDAIRHQFAIAVAKNETIHQMTRRMMRMDSKRTKGTEASEIAQGLFHGRFWDAERLVRTEMQNTYNAYHHTAIDNAGLNKRWDASADKRLCYLCSELDGKTVDSAEEFPGGYMHPPRHPNCRCTLIPWDASWPELTALAPLEDRNAQRLALAGDPSKGAQARVIAKKPEKKKVKGGYSFDPTKPVPEDRRRMHAAYRRDVTAGIPTSDEPVVYMTGGGPASGKSSGLLENPHAEIPGKQSAAHIDPDGAKLAIPEYNEMVKKGNRSAAAKVHEESSLMSKEAISYAIKRGHNVVYDSVGDSGITKLTEKVEKMRAAGARRVVAEYATIDVAEALRRASLRAKQTGRVVPRKDIIAMHKDVAQTSVAAIERGLFDSMRIWDTGGKTPKLVATYTRAEGLTVHDEEAWLRHKERGK